ncbi:MAG: hypothetical protein DI607_13520 [Sphingomonas hengshuiensis]|nr:MAG: hypothetical protein DI607_13520 [Sphingomonas hengshuiensis]
MSVPRHQIKVNLPSDQKAFIETEASRNGSSQNSEIVRCIRERMDRMVEPTATPLPAVAQEAAS